MISREAPRRVLVPRSPRELSELLAAHPSALLVAGGTIAFPLWRARGAPDTVMHLGAVAGLDVMTPNRCGTSVRLEALRRDVAIPRAVRQAAGSVGGPAIRAMATVGGNTIAAGPGCVAVALLAIDAQALVTPRAGDGKPVSVPVRDVLGADDLVLTSIHWANPDASAFSKVAVRAAGGPNILSAAVSRRTGMRGIAIGAPGSVPHRLHSAETLWRQGETVELIARAAAREAVVSDTGSASGDYRRAVVTTLVRRLINEVEGNT